MGCISNNDGKFHAVLFPFMSKGHTIPILHLARLLLRRNIAVTVFTTPANHPFIAASLTNTAASVITLAFPRNIPGVPSHIESTDKLPSMSLFPHFALATVAMQQDFERALEILPRVNFMVSDGFLWWTMDYCEKLSIPRLVFYGMSSYSSCVSKVVSEDRLLFGSDSDNDLITVTKFPWIKVARNDFEPVFKYPEQNRAHTEFIIKVLMASSKSFGYFLNSFYELESTFVDYWNENCEPKSWCIGPLCLAEPAGGPSYNPSRAWIFQWLDQKLEQGKSVLYVAFGSQAEMSLEQVKEIAIGLEESKVNFLWVVRQQETELGEGFEERVKERGIVVRDWVDQREILKHKCVEGFLSHCGWNSVMESICEGVPILAWPLMAEQPLNARMVEEEIKVGLRVEKCDGGFVKSEEIKKMVKELMEGEVGEEVRRKIKEYAVMAKKAMEEGTGSSWQTLEMIINETCNS